MQSARDKRKIRVDLHGFTALHAAKAKGSPWGEPFYTQNATFRISATAQRIIASGT